MNEGLIIDDNEDYAFYQSGLSADGCLEKLDDYTRKAIKRYGEILLEKQKEDFVKGFKGCCYCCEPVGLLNQKLEKERDQYKEMLNQLAEPLLEKVDEAVQFRIKEIKEERDEAREELRNVHNLYCKKCDEILKLTFENRRLSQERDQYKEMFDMQTKIVVDLEMRLIKMEEQLNERKTILY